MIFSVDYVQLWSVFSYQRRGWSEFQTTTTPWTFLFLILPPLDRYEFDILHETGVPDAPNFCKTIRGFVKEEGIRVWTLKYPADAWIWYSWSEESTKKPILVPWEFVIVPSQKEKEKEEEENRVMLVSRPVFLSKWLRTISEASGNWWRFYEATCLADFFDYWGRLWVVIGTRFSVWMPLG